MRKRIAILFAAILAVLVSLSVSLTGSPATEPVVSVHPAVVQPVESAQQVAHEQYVARYDVALAQGMEAAVAFHNYYVAQANAAATAAAAAAAKQQQAVTYQAPSSAPTTSGGGDGGWSIVATCEESGNNDSTYGYYGIMPQSWGGYGGYSTAGQAPMSVQQQRGDQINGGGPPSEAGGCHSW